MKTSNKKTISTYLKGGIGNQLFQIIFSQNLAKTNQFDLEYCLDFFSIDGYKRNSILRRLWPESTITSTLPAATTGIIEESTLNWPSCAGTEIKITLPVEITHLKVEGYWQDYKILSKDIVDDLKVRLANAAPENFNKLYTEIKNLENSTAVHIRRHDYKHHGIAKEKYYIDALNWLTKRFGELNIFLFSDEPNYAKHLLSENNFKINLIDSGDDILDLYLMSACNFQVIANSSYSWWSAVLSNSKTVICPDPWSLIGSTSTTLCPNEWLKIGNSVENSISDENYLGQLDYEYLRSQKELFLKDRKLPEGLYIGNFPCFNDASSNTGFDAHYVYHTAWATRRLINNSIDEHVDIGSDIRFVTLASAFQKINFLDYRPAQINLDNLTCGHTDLMNLNFKNESVKSLSCMHVVEHIGLGRYGDEINYNGSTIAMKELQRVLAIGGLLYFVVPVGKPAIYFNAHRIFKPSYICEQFSELDLIEFSYISDNGIMIENVELSAAEDQNYACGCFLFKRNSTSIKNIK